MQKARGSLLIEATCNQVNQFDGYTGMTPADFVRYMRGIAEEPYRPHRGRPFSLRPLQQSAPALQGTQDRAFPGLGERLHPLPRSIHPVGSRVPLVRAAVGIPAGGYRNRRQA